MYIAYGANNKLKYCSLIGQTLTNERAGHAIVVCAICYVHLRKYFTTKNVDSMCE